MKKLILASLFMATTSFAADCMVKTDRKPCPGKEAETLKPYGGVNPKEEKKDAADGPACKALAEKSAKIVRKGTLLEKTVTATFGKESFGPFKDTSTCK